MVFKSSICEKCTQCKKEKCEHDAYVRIKDGKLSDGTIDEKAIGSMKGKILDKIARDYGSNYSREFLDNVTRIAIGAIMVQGFTTGIDDEDIPKESQLQIQDMLQRRIGQGRPAGHRVPQGRARTDARTIHGGDPGGRGHEGAGTG